MKKRYVVAGLTVILGLILFFTDDENVLLSTPPVATHQNEEPDYYGINLERRFYGTDGKLQQVFTAARSEHYPEAAFTRFTVPHLISTNAQDQSWEITSKTGEMLDKAQQLSMISNVTVNPLNTDPDEHWVLTTELLHYHIKRQFAETDQPVQITNPSTKINAIGMNLYVQDQNLELLQQVHTRHAPPASE